MKKILGLGAVMLLVMALLAGGTWAYFSDYQSSTDNVLAAGTLDVGLSNTNTQANGDASNTWSLSNMAPGSWNQSSLFVSNNGTLPMGTVNITCSYNISGTMPLSVHNTTGDITTNDIEKMIYISNATWNGSPISPTTLDGKTLFELATNNYTIASNFAPGATGNLSLNWTFNSSATNGCQNRTITTNITIYGFQN